MIKRCIIVFLAMLLPLMLGSWVDPYTVDVYNAQIIFASSDYEVADLSGYVQYYFNDYDDVGLTVSGYLFNAGPDTYSGSVLVNGVEYPCRLSSLSELQIQQTYTSSGYVRTTWVNYHAIPDVVPQNYSVPEFAIVFIVFAVILILAVSVIGRGVVL